MFEKINVRKWTRRDWVLLSTFAAITLAGIAVGHLNDPTSGTAGTGSIAELIKQDVTPAYPYADASQCPLSTDLVFARTVARSRTCLPVYRSALLGNQSFNNSGGRSLRFHAFRNRSGILAMLAPRLIAREQLGTMSALPPKAAPLFHEWVSLLRL